jgi:ubiquinone/menaquinone biosynthesis C-methylase UbiE
VSKTELSQSTISRQAIEIRKLWSGFQSARVLLTANNYRIFDFLIKQKAVADIAHDIGADKRAVEIVLDALTGLGLLKKQQNKYKNTTIASRFLVSGTPLYQGDIIKHADTLWHNWSGLDTVVKTGTPFRTSQNHCAFILGMHNLAVFKAGKIIKGIGLRGVRTALDLGGGPGTYAVEMAQRGICVTLFDTPDTIKIAKRVIDKKKKKNLNFIGGDFFYDNLGKDYDLVLISQIFHSYSKKNNIMLLKRCKKALNKNGRIVIQEFFIDENRTHPSRSALFSINMLVNTEGGRCYSPDEIKDWLYELNFRNVRKIFIADSILISAQR